MSFKAVDISYQIRPARPEDLLAIKELTRAAFKKEGEADLVETITNSDDLVLSLVAESAGGIIGHVLFSRMSLESEVSSESKVVGLGPLSVSPGYQKQGIGSQLIKSSLEILEKDWDAVFLLGHSEYYPKFGFLPASKFGIKSTFDCADENFMCFELKTGALKNASGVVHYCKAFDNL